MALPREGGRGGPCHGRRRGRLRREPLGGADGVGCEVGEGDLDLSAGTDPAHRTRRERDEEVFVVDDAHGLLAFDRRTGKKLWENPDGSYVGPPLVAGDELVVARNDGHIERLDFDGKRTGGWDGAVAGNPIDGDPTFSIGPVAGGGALWAATDKASVVRLGLQKRSASHRTDLGRRVLRPPVLRRRPAVHRDGIPRRGAPARRRQQRVPGRSRKRGGAQGRQIERRLGQPLDGAASWRRHPARGLGGCAPRRPPA